MPPTLRIASEADTDLLLGFMREYYTFDGHAFDRAKARDALLGILRDESLGRVWLVCDGDIAVGYIVVTYGYSLEYLGRDAFVDEFYLRVSHRGRGWGRQILDRVEQAARSQGIRALHLEVVRANRSALQVYRKLGFRDHDHYLMTKWIDPMLKKPSVRD
jgi:GNAT superfamily N-acetyltransferase